MMLEPLLAKSDVLLQIIGINLIMSGDNALIIAMATRGLPKSQQRLGTAIGVTAALVMRIALSVGLWRLLEIPGLHLLGGLALLYIALQLGRPQAKTPTLAVASITLGIAVRQIMIGDVMMSADNVLAVAAAARGDLTLMAIGITLCIPMIVLGSNLLGRLIERWHWILIIGSGLLGWVAGELLNEDSILDQIGMPIAIQDSLAPLCASIVLSMTLAHWFQSRQTPKDPS